MSSRAEQEAALTDDLKALHQAGGLGYWSFHSRPLLALAGLEAVRGQAGSKDVVALTHAIAAVLKRATDSLEPRSEGEAARELLGITQTAAPLRSPRERERLAAERVRKKWATYKRRYAVLTLGCVATWLLDHDRLTDEGPVPAAGIDHESSLEELAGAMRQIPAIAGPAFMPLASVRLDEDLRRVLAGTYHALRCMHDQQTFLSFDSALELRELAYDNDNDDWVYVLARRDQGTNPGFVEQRGWARHVRWLRHHARHRIPPPQLATAACDSSPATGENELGVRQIRVVIAEDYRTALASVAELMDLHRSNTLFYFPAPLLSSFQRLRRLRYGMTVSTSHEYAMVSVPPTGRPPTTDLRKPSNFVEHYLTETSPYRADSGDMRAVVTASTKYVGDLKKEFEQLIASKHVHRIPCTCEAGVA